MVGGSLVPQAELRRARRLMGQAHQPHACMGSLAQAPRRSLEHKEGAYAP